MADTIEDLVRADHEKCNDKFNNLEQMAAQFQRGDTVYCARVEKTQVTVRYGIINRIIYKNGDMIFNIAPSESTMADFTISSRNWNIFELEQDMYDYIHSVINADPNEDTPTDGEETPTQG